MESRFRNNIVTFIVPFAVLVTALVLLQIVGDELGNYVVNLFRDGYREAAQSAFDTFLRLAKLLLWMSLVIVVVRFINSLIFSVRRSSQTSSLIRNIFSITVYIVAFFMIFKTQYPGVDLAALFTTSAILGVILGLALQDTLGNLFAGISLQADQPFLVGDVINISNRGTGVVENITWRGIKIRTFQNKLLNISNSVLGKETFEVAPRNNLNARLIYFSTLYTDSPTRTIHVVREAVREAENVSTKIKPIVRIKNLGDNGIEWEIKYWLEDYSRYNDTDALLRQRIWYAFLREGINFAYPTRTLYVKRRQPRAKQEDETYKVFERLSAIEIFEPLSDEETMQLARHTERRIFAPGEVIIREGEAGNTMFVINRGSVNIIVSDAAAGNGKQRTLSTLQEGKFFGEMAVFTGEPRTATVVAAEETEVFEIGHKAVKNLFDANPYLVESLSKAIAERRAMLNATAEPKHEAVEKEHAGVFSAVKRFFGIS